MMRWDIINHLIKKNNHKSYLEIGYYKGWSFDRVECQYKTAVDPNPSKTEDQVALKMGDHQHSLIKNEKSGVHDRGLYLWKMTSDEFFSFIAPDHNYDIIFIDGLHESQQVDRDIQNALKHLSPGGTIVMHDCNPSSLEMTTTGTKLGEWTGDVYKSFIDFKYANEVEYSCYVIDTDYGVGIIHEANKFWNMTRISPLPLYIRKRDYYSFSVFEANKVSLLHLVKPEDFLFIDENRRTAANETTTDNNSPA
jgi:hypothetical protein